MKLLKKAVIVLTSAVLAASMSACGTRMTVAEEVLSQKPSLENRTKITVLVKYAFTINSFEEAVEERFPDIDIVQVGNYTRDMGIAEYESRMEHDDLTDIVMTWPIEAGQEYCEERLIDLSGMNFTSRYNISMLNSIADEGKLYYLPGPAQVRGIVYNKTLFKEKGWEVPEDFEGFISLCKEIEESGMRSIQLGFGNAEVLDTAFIGFNYETHFSKPQDIQWLTDYNKGKGSFGEHFDEAVDVFLRMKEEGIWKAEDLSVTYSDREKMLFTRQCAMMEDSVLMARMGYAQTGITDEFGLMPFFSPGAEGDWARLYMVCYIGLNKHLEEPENKEKYAQVLKLMDYISTPEGQAALSADTGAMISSLSGVVPPDIPEIADLEDALLHGRYAVFPKFQNASDALEKGLAGLLLNTTDKEEFVKMVDEENRSFAEEEITPSIGTASESFTLTETGNFVTDAMAAYSGCEIALFLDNGKDGRYNGKGISGRLYEGDVTQKDLERILPDLKYDDKGTLNKTTMTGEDLIRTLEYAIPVNNNEQGWFYYFSGIKMEYDPVKEPGERIHKITTSDGTPIDKDKIYTVAVMDASVPEECLSSCEKTNVTIMSILEQAVQKAGTIKPVNEDRFLIPAQ